MIALESSYRIDVLNAFQALQASFQTLSESILRDVKYPIWIQDAPLENSYMARQMALSQIGLFEYLPLQEPRETVLCVGLIGSSAKTLEAAAAFNRSKLKFKQTILALRQAKIAAGDAALTQGFESLLGSRSNDARESLKKMGFARLHLKQCYRTLPLLTKMPTKVRWTWAHTRAIQRITVEEAITLLKKRGNDYGIQQQMTRCATLSSETPLAIVQELAPHLRANLVYGDKETGYERQMIKAPLPILFPADETTPLPDYKACKPKELRNENRIIRIDTKLDPNPFLPAIRAHRYIC